MITRIDMYKDIVVNVLLVTILIATCWLKGLVHKFENT